MYIRSCPNQGGIALQGLVLRFWDQGSETYLELGRGLRKHSFWKKMWVLFHELGFGFGQYGFRRPYSASSVICIHACVSLISAGRHGIRTCTYSSIHLANLKRNRQEMKRFSTISPKINERMHVSHHPIDWNISEVSVSSQNKILEQPRYLMLR